MSNIQCDKCGRVIASLEQNHCDGCVAILCDACFNYDTNKTPFCDECIAEVDDDEQYQNA